MQVKRVTAHPELDPRSPELGRVRSQLTSEIARTLLPEALEEVTTGDVDRYGSRELAAALKTHGLAAMVVGEALVRQGVGWPAGVSLVLHGENGPEEIIFE